jgi:hypothetical protein
MRTQIASIFFFGLILGFMWLVPATCADEVYTITSGVAENETGMYLPGFITETAPTTLMSSEGNQTESSVVPASKSAGLLRSAPSSPRPGIEWQNVYGASYTEEFASIRQTPDGGYIACGLTDAYYPNGDVMSFIGSGDAWVMKLDASGNPEWQNAFGGIKRDECRSIRPVSDGYIFVGFSNSVNGEFADKNHGGYDIYVVKLRLDGSVEWQQQVGGENDDVGTSIRQTADGGFIITGYEDFSHSGKICQFTEMTNAWVIKLNPDGTVQWQKKLEGNKGDQGTGIIQARDGNYVMYGFSNSESGPGIGGNHGNYDLWIVKMDSYGAILWNSMYGGSGFEATNNVNDDGIQQTADDGFVIIGQTSSYNNGDVGTNHGMSDVWVVKLSQYGNLQWQKPIGGREYDMASGSIHQTADGGYALAGMTRSSNSGDVGENHGDWDFWVARLDKSYEDGNGGHLAGELLWQEVLGGNGYEMADSLQPTSDGGYIVSGWTDSNSDGDVGMNHGESDAWVVKLPPHLVVDVRDSDTHTLVPNAKVVLTDVEQADDLEMVTTTGRAVFDHSGALNQYKFETGKNYSVSVSAAKYRDGVPADVVFSHDGQLVTLNITAIERPTIDLTYSTTDIYYGEREKCSCGEINNENLRCSAPVCEMRNVDRILQNANPKWTKNKVLSKVGYDVTKESLGSQGGGLTGSTLHYHAGHGIYSPDQPDKSGIMLYDNSFSNEIYLTPSDVLRKWGGKNKWIIISACDVLKDYRWGEALSTTHGILGFTTPEKRYPTPALPSSFFQYAMDEKRPISMAWENATKDTFHGAIVKDNDGHEITMKAGARFANIYQYENDHLPGYGIIEPDVINPLDTEFRDWSCNKEAK